VNKFNQMLLGSMLYLMGSSAMAVVMAPISGTLEMTGSAQISQQSVIDFTRNQFISTSADGDFSGVSRFGDIQSIQLDPFTGPVADFWTIDAFSFELTDLLFDFNSTSSSTFLSITGNGILRASGYEDTDASWRLSGNTSGGDLFAWSATVNPRASDVPEPGVLALLSLGLIGMVVRLRFKK
jgi:hypothetical protein